MIPERSSFIFRAEQAAALKFRNHVADEILQTLRKGRRQDIETIGGGARDPFFHDVSNVVGCATQREMRPHAAHPHIELP